MTGASARSALLRLLGDCLAVEASGPAGAFHDLRRRHRRDGLATHETALIGLANEGLVTPALYAALRDRKCLGAFSPTARLLLYHANRLNRHRNARLVAQLAETARAFNDAGVRPLVLKGTVQLLDPDPSRLGRRMITDLDVLVPAARLPDVEGALRAIGYTRTRDFDLHPHTHEIADFARPADLGALDLHQELLSFAGHLGGRGHLRGLLPVPEVMAEARPAHLDGAEVLVPSPRHRLLHRILHDQVQDRDHFAGRLNIRYLLDVAELLAAHRDIDVAGMIRAVRPHGLAPAVASHLIAAHDLFAAPLPAEVLRQWWPRVLRWRRMLLVGHPWLTPLNSTLGAIAYEFSRCRYPPDASPARLAMWRASRLGDVLRRRNLDVFAQLRDVAWRL